MIEATALCVEARAVAVDAGHLIGQVVLSALTTDVRAWLAEHGRG